MLSLKILSLVKAAADLLLRLSHLVGFPYYLLPFIVRIFMHLYSFLFPSAFVLAAQN